jgi:hypothetical protein
MAIQWVTNVKNLFELFHHPIMVSSMAREISPETARNGQAQRQAQP